MHKVSLNKNSSIQNPHHIRTQQGFIHVVTLQFRGLRTSGWLSTWTSPPGWRRSTSSRGTSKNSSSEQGSRPGRSDQNTLTAGWIRRTKGLLSSDWGQHTNSLRESYSCSNQTWGKSMENLLQFPFPMARPRYKIIWQTEAGLQQPSSAESRRSVVEVTVTSCEYNSRCS